MLSDTMLSTVTGKSAGETWKTIILKTSPHPESYLERYKIDDLQHITIPWLPKLGTNRNMDLKEVGFIQTIYYYCDVKFTLANLLARAFSIILKKEYHANCLELFPFWNIIDQSHVLRSMWFVKFNESLGIDLIHAIADKFEEIILLSGTEINNGILVKEVYNILYNLVSDYCSIPSHGCDEKPKLCTNAKDFVLEPCVLIQLPWKTVLLHQWLVVALIEVLLIEKESMELRHWPLPENLVAVASETLLLIKNLKERITLGFAIMCRMAHTHPNIDPNLHGYIMDVVVAPSVPVLSFLVTGKARQVVKSIKMMAWSKPQPHNSDLSTLPDQC